MQPPFLDTRSVREYGTTGLPATVRVEMDMLPSIIFIRLIARFLRLSQLRHPNVIRLVLVDVGENQVKNFRVPAHRVAFDAFFDILRIDVSSRRRGVGHTWNLLVEALTNQTCCRRGK